MSKGMEFYLKNNTILTKWVAIKVNGGLYAKKGQWMGPGSSWRESKIITKL